MKRDIKVCTIGGGSGMPIVNKALVEAGFKDIHSIVTTFDSGGDTGRMRTDERGNILAFSDYWRSLISLWKDGEQKKIWEEMLRYRDGRGRNFGNIFFQFMSEKTGDLLKVDALFSDLTGAKIMGEVIPVSQEPSDLYFETISGKKYKGEHHLDDLRMSYDRVKKIWLNPEVKASNGASKSIEEADVVIVGPGSIYGSMIVNFLPKGMAESFRKSKAKKILIVNLVSLANEVEKFDSEVCNQIFGKYIYDNCFDMVIEPDFGTIKKDLLEEVRKNYALENSQLFESDNKNSFDVVTVDRKNKRLRHDVSKLAKLFSKILVK